MLHLNPETPRIIVPLFAHTLDELEVQAKAAQAAPEADLAELRLDPLREGDWLSQGGAKTADRDHPHGAGGGRSGH